MCLISACVVGAAPTTSEWSTMQLPTKVRLMLETWRYWPFTDSTRLSDAYMYQQTGPSLVHIMTCCLFGTKPLFGPMLTHVFLIKWMGTTFNEILMKTQQFVDKKLSLKSSSDGYFLHAFLILTHQYVPPQIPAYDHVKHTLLGWGWMKEGVQLHVVSSMIAGFMTALTTSPVDVVKTRVMNQKGKGENMRSMLYMYVSTHWPLGDVAVILKM